MVWQHRVKREFVIPWAFFPIGDKDKAAEIYYDLFEEMCIHFASHGVADACHGSCVVQWSDCGAVMVLV